jgi:hypothetical protein
MKVKELYDFCKLAIARGYGDADVYFDTEALCFDTHYVKVYSPQIEVLLEDRVVLHFDPSQEIYHYNRD